MNVTAKAPLPAPAQAAVPRPYTVLPDFGDSVAAAPLLRIGGEAFRMQATARTDSAQSLRYTEPPTAFLNASPADSAQCNTVAGLEVVYTFRLLCC